MDAAWALGLAGTSPNSPGTRPDESAAPGAAWLSGGEPGGGGAGGGAGADSGLIPGRGSDATLRLFTVGFLTSTVTTVALAFLMFGRRRRDERQPASDDVLAAAAASGYPILPGSLMPATLVPAMVTVAVDPGTGGTDVDLPRWRRPSLLAARKSDPIREVPAHANLTFEREGAACSERERRCVRYRIVQLLDRPDELQGLPIGSLDEGDEVEVVDRHALYRRVVTPDGRQGWLHRMTLGDVVEDDPDPESEPDADVGHDLLTAYLAARARG